jgi:molybdenum cofactor cytidylyltransferase
MKISTIILAAGESSRLGQPKQLLTYENQTLIERIISITKTIDFEKTIVVLGAFAKQIEPILAATNVDIVINENWQNGMSSSLKKGLENTKKSDAILVLLSDQPFVNSELIHQLIEKGKRSDFPIIATKYQGVFGVPALFKKIIFEALENLNEQVGAKKVIKNYAKNNQVGFVSFEKAAIDIDTIEDYDKLLNTIGT